MLTDFDAERDPDDGSVMLYWRRNGRLIGLVCFPNGKLMRISEPELPTITTHIEALTPAPEPAREASA